VTPLHKAAGDGRLEVVRLLLAKGADRGLQTRAGRTPLDLARQGGHPAVVRLLEAP